MKMSRTKWLVAVAVVAVLLAVSGWVMWRSVAPVAVPATQVFAEGEGYFDEASGFALTYPEAWRPYNITAMRTMDSNGVSSIGFVAHIGDKSPTIYAIGVTPLSQWSAHPCAGLETECDENRTELGRNGNFVFDGDKVLRDPCDAQENDPEFVVTDAAFCTMFAAMTDDAAKGHFTIPQ